MFYANVDQHYITPP